MIKKESKFSLKFRHWLRANPIEFSCTFEIKDTRGADSFPFKEFKEAQGDWGMAIRSKRGTLMRQVGGQGEPDYTYHYNEPSFIVINYPLGFVLINVQTFIFEKERSKRKSLTWSQALSIATIEVIY